MPEHMVYVTRITVRSGPCSEAVHSLLWVYDTDTRNIQRTMLNRV